MKLSAVMSVASLVSAVSMVIDVALVEKAMGCEGSLSITPPMAVTV